MTQQTWQRATLLRAPLVLALLLLPWGFSSCSLLQRQIYPRWVEGEVKSNSEGVLFDVIQVSLQKAGYPVGVGADRGARQVVSGWYSSGAPFKGKGYRQRATVEYSHDAAPDSVGQFSIRVRIQREINDSFRPLDPRYADWTEAEDNPQEAERVLQYIRSFLVGGEFKLGPTPTLPGPPSNS